MIKNERLDPYILMNTTDCIEELMDDVKCDDNCEDCVFKSPLENPVGQKKHGCALGLVYNGLIKLLRGN